MDDRYMIRLVDRLFDSQDRVGMNQWMDGFEVITRLIRFISYYLYSHLIISFY